MTTASRAGLQRLEHRHGGSHPVGAGDVAGRRDDAALPAADDHRLVGEAGLSRFSTAAKNASQSTWAIAERVPFADGEQARGAAGRAALRRRSGPPVQAVAAERGADAPGLHGLNRIPTARGSGAPP